MLIYYNIGYDSLAESWVVFYVDYPCGCQRLQTSLVFLSPLLSLDFLRVTFTANVHLSALVTVTILKPCSCGGNSWGGRSTYNLIIKFGLLVDVGDLRCLCALAEKKCTSKILQRRKEVMSYRGGQPEWV